MKNIFLSIATAALALTATSCLDLEPMDQLSDTNLWTKPGDFESFANQMYGWTNTYNEIVYSAGPHGDKRSDLLCDKSSHNNYSRGENTVPAGSSLSDGNYSAFYSRIRRTNILISRAENYTGSISDIAQPLGEAHFFRAYTYYELLTIYGDAPLIDHELDIDDPDLYAPRANRLDVANFIVDDLHAAIAHLKSFSELETGRISREGAQAFLSRVALYEASWQKFHNNNPVEANRLYTEAADAAKAVIDSKKFGLFYNATLASDSYRYLFILEDTRCNPAGLTKGANNEFIFSRCYTTENPIGRNITAETLGNAQMATRKFVDMFLCMDGLPIDISPKYQSSNEKMDTEWKDRDNRMHNILLKPGTKYWDNTAEHSRTAWNSADDSRALTWTPPSGGTGYYTYKYGAERQVTNTNETYDYPIIRYAEVLLNYAEALFERDDKISDADLNLSLNLTRRRINSNMPALTNAFAEANNLDMRTEIRRERTIELFNEGFRIDDLKRWKTAEAEMPGNLCGITLTGEYKEKWTQNSLPLNSLNQVIYEDARQFQQKHYLYPLPSDQLQLNSQLTQNPGW